MQTEMDATATRIEMIKPARRPLDHWDCEDSSAGAMVDRDKTETESSAGNRRNKTDHLSLKAGHRLYPDDPSLLCHIRHSLQLHSLTRFRDSPVAHQ